MQSTRKILSLDLGRKMGWAVRRKNGDIHSGMQHFKQDRFSGGGMAFLNFRVWLDTFNQADKIEIMVFEEVRRHLGTDAAHLYGAFMGQATAWAEEHKIPYLGVPVGTIKRHITGKGNASKEEVIRSVVGRGYAPMDDNEADALALLLYAIDEKIGG